MELKFKQKSFFYECSARWVPFLFIKLLSKIHTVNFSQNKSVSQRERSFPPRRKAKEKKIEQDFGML